MSVMRKGQCFIPWESIHFNSYNEYQNKYESLKADEKRLDRLFDKTSYGKELIEVTTELADRVIAQLGNKELKKAAVTVAEDSFWTDNYHHLF